MDLLNFNELKFPFLKFFNSNRLIVDESVFSEMIDFPTGLSTTKNILKHFDEQNIPIYLITKPTHQQLQETKSFITNKSFLAQSPEMTFLILFPENLIPQVVDEDVEWNANELKMNCALVTVLKWATMDLARYGKHEVYNRSDYDCDEDYEHDRSMYEDCRWLNFLPIQLDRFFHIHNDSISAVDDEFGTSFNEFGRTINGNIIDYLWSFVIHYNLNVLSKTNSSQKVIVGNMNHIEVL